MSQATTWGVPTVGPSTPTDYAARDRGSLDALLSSHSGAAEPAYKVRGTIWEDTTANQLKRWTGTAWRVISEDLAQATLLGRASGAGTGDRQQLTPTQAATVLGFAQSIAANGYVKLPGGIILQWGGLSVPGVDTAITFPIAFPNTCLSANISPAGGTVAQRAHIVWIHSTPTATGMVATPRYVDQGGAVGLISVSAYWMALGW